MRLQHFSPPGIIPRVSDCFPAAEAVSVVELKRTEVQWATKSYGESEIHDLVLPPRGMSSFTAKLFLNHSRNTWIILKRFVFQMNGYPYRRMCSCTSFLAIKFIQGIPV